MVNEFNAGEIVDEIILSAYDGHKRLETAIESGNHKNINLDMEMALDRKHTIIIKGCMVHIHHESMNKNRKAIIANEVIKNKS
jgi:hypothetical protein